MNETINKATGETIKYNRIGGTPENPIYFNDPTPTSTTPLTQTAIPVSALPTREEKASFILDAKLGLILTTSSVVSGVLDIVSRAFSLLNSSCDNDIYLLY